MKNVLFAVASVCVALLAFSLVQPALAWHGEGHERASVLAASSLPQEIPAFMRAGKEAIGQYSMDPDVYCRPIAPDELGLVERPEHFIDLEPLEGMELPAKRYDLLRLCYKKGLDPATVGMVPYAIEETTQRLTVTFAEYRKWPDNVQIQQRCLFYAGILAHYAEDACQPLHTTIHYDGRVGADGHSPKTGIHSRVDALLTKLAADTKVQIDPKDVQPFELLFPAIVKQIQDSHALVDRVYELEKDIPAAQDPLPASGPVVEFARERLQASAIFTARLYATAWRNSEKIAFPSWHHRPEHSQAAAAATSMPAIHGSPAARNAAPAN